MDTVLSIALMIVMMVVLLGGAYLWYRSKIANIRKELTLLKKEKEYIKEAIVVRSDKGKIEYANQTAKTLFGLDKNLEIAPNARAVQLKVKSSYADDFFKVVELKASTQDELFSLPNVSLLKGDRDTLVDVFVEATGENGKPKALSCVIDMLPSRQAHQEQPKTNNGSLDYLTGLSSQFLAFSDINALCRELQKKSEMFTLFLVGIDEFKELQIVLGLSYTNRILKDIGGFFLQYPPKDMKVYAMDGGKFLLLLKGGNDEEALRNRAREVMVAIGTSLRGHNDIRLTSSVGIVSYPKDGENASKLIDNAYIALDTRELNSQSNIQFFNHEHKMLQSDEITMNREIIIALKNNQFLLHYQPIFELEGEVVIGAEALLRWEHPRHGLISANKFLHIAEKTGVITQLGEYVFNEAIQQRKRISHSDEFTITVNLSLKEMQVEALIPKLEKLFEQYQVRRSSINLDVSESTAIENIEKTSNDFKLLNDFGLSLSLDNFGAGASSFKYLALLPINLIKIDRSLIFDLTLNVTHQTTVKAIIDMAHTFGYKVVAEGVESKEEASLLTSLKCNYVQGYLYSKPLAQAEFEALLK